MNILPKEIWDKSGKNWPWNTRCGYARYAKMNCAHLLSTALLLRGQLQLLLQQFPVHGGHACLHGEHLKVAVHRLGHGSLPHVRWPLALRRPLVTVPLGTPLSATPAPTPSRVVPPHHRAVPPTGLRRDASPAARSTIPLKEPRV